MSSNISNFIVTRHSSLVTSYFIIKINMSKGKKTIKRKFQGIVISDKMDKTVVVKVDRVKLHSKYHKRYTVSKNYKAHDEKNEYKAGDRVIIQECRPLSKDKRWRMVKKIGHGVVVEDLEDKEVKELDSLKEVQKIERKVEAGSGESRVDEQEKKLDEEKEVTSN